MYTGPPIPPPPSTWRSRVLGRPKKFEEKGLALKNSLRASNRPLPCTWFAPDFITKLKTPPEDLPYSALMPLVSTLNSCRASGDGLSSLMSPDLYPVAVAPDKDRLGEVRRPDQIVAV